MHECKLKLDGEKDYSGKKNILGISTLSKPPMPEAPEGFLGDVVKAAQFFGEALGPIKWFLSGTLDIPRSGDINKKVQINIV